MEVGKDEFKPYYGHLLTGSQKDILETIVWSRHALG